MIHEAIILDTETTDVKEAEVIELAFKVFLLNTPTDIFTSRYKPEKDSTLGALATHHILPQELSDCPPSDTAPISLPLASYYIGHNVDFDMEALGWPEGKRICTLAMSRHIWSDLDSHKLVAMMYHLHGASESTREMVKGAHGASADVGMTEKLLVSIMSVKGITSIPALWEFSEVARIPTKWNFGKFKGEPLEAADRGYVNWYRKQADTDPYLIKALKLKGMI